MRIFHRHASGRINGAWLAFLASIALLVLLVFLLRSDGSAPAAGSTSKDSGLILYCAAGIKAPVEAAARAYEKENGVRVELQYGGSQTLLSNLSLSGRGDLFLPADDSYLTIAREKNLIAEAIPLASMQGVIAVKKGNPAGIKTFDDLLKAGVKIAQANPDAAAIGKLTRQVLQKRNKWDALEKHTTVFKGTVNDATTDVKVGSVDAAVSWDAVAGQMTGVDAVRLPELEGVTANIAVAVLKSSAQPSAALRFAHYLGARDKGLLEFKRFGYPPVDGDPWTPEAK